MTYRRLPKAAGHWGGLLVLALVLAAQSVLASGTVSSEKKQSRPVLAKQNLVPVLADHLARLRWGTPVELIKSRLGRVIIHPTIERRLQRQAEKLLAGTRSRRTAIVLLEARTGKVLALAGARAGRLDPRVALQAGGPAASLFKIITAAAALEDVNLRPSTQLKFVGRPHTLYKYQLRKKQTRRGRKISLADGFAKSNNPVFGRLGVHHVGQDLLLWYARMLGFDQKLPFEAPVGMSRVHQPRNWFEVASVASGFDRVTTISPLHAALLVSVFLNGGRFMEPYLVAKVLDRKGDLLYRGTPRGSKRLISSQTCRDMRRLFKTTITKGTARKAFRRYKRDRILRYLELGGKTGTLRGQGRKELFQWFAGYGRDSRTGKTIVAAIMAVHGKRIYANPRKLARSILREAFRHHPTRLAANPKLRPRL